MEKRFVEFGLRMQVIRGKRSPTECARNWGIKPSYIYRYEDGSTMPGGEILKLIAEREGINLNWLLGLDEGPIYRGSMTRPPPAKEELLDREMLRELKRFGIETMEQLKILTDENMIGGAVVQMVRDEGSKYLRGRKGGKKE
jgi:hypothetical protein